VLESITLEHRLSRCPGESDLQLACCFQTWSTAGEVWVGGVQDVL